MNTATNRDIAQLEDEIVDEFAVLEDPLTQYEYLIDLGKKLPQLDEQYRNEDNIVKGCQSIVYLNSTFSEGRMYYAADSNTVITKGIIALLIRVLSGQRPVDIIGAKLD